MKKPKEVREKRSKEKFKVRGTPILEDSNAILEIPRGGP